ncbi:MAG: NAD(P)H-hydrate epimerase, partial [Thermoplasmata archaeon]|nr:NAD(P)H-hydrate epimerase [Thermoplasmata archaeon]
MIDAIEARVVDLNSEALGIPGSQLMENAGRLSAEFIMSLSKPSKIVIICGTGNNGGDGAVIARYLDEAGWRVTLALVKLKSNTRTNTSSTNIFKLSSSVTIIENANPEILASHPFIVDAMLGIGLKAAPREPYAT